MSRMSIKVFVFFSLVFGTIACQPEALIEPAQVEAPTEFTPFEEDLLGPCGKQAGTVYDWACGLVLVTDKGETYELDPQLGFESAQRISYQVASDSDRALTECANVQTIQFSCLEEL